MYCPKCGTLVEDQAVKCMKCGCELQPATSPQPEAPIPSGPAPTSAKAIISLVLGILGLACCWIFAGIPAIILGVLAKKDISAKRGVLSGNGFATAGIILGAVSIISPVFFMFVAISIPGFLPARENYSKGCACRENLAKIDFAKEQWALENKLTNGTPITDSEAFLHNPKIFGPDGYVKRIPVCPSGGTYSVNAIGEDPTCSIGDSNAPFTPHKMPE